jgi:hypothetical protein
VQGRRAAAAAAQLRPPTCDPAAAAGDPLVDGLDADLAELDAKLQELIAPFAHAVDRLDESPGSARPPRSCSSPRSGPT